MRSLILMAALVAIATPAHAGSWFDLLRYYKELHNPKPTVCPKGYILRGNTCWRRIY